MALIRRGDSGSKIMEIQEVLKKLGYNVGRVDGVFGPGTLRAVIEFQMRHSLSSDGIIGPDTYYALRPYLEGYESYTVRTGDTIPRISSWFGVPQDFIRAANPGAELAPPAPGSIIRVPYNYDVVDTNIYYTSAIMQRDIVGLKARYPFLEISSAGRSVLDKDLSVIRIGLGENTVFYNASHHAVEWITTPVLMKFIENYARSYVLGGEIGGYNTRRLYENSSIYIMPMVNPDGVDLAIDGLKRDNPYYDDLLKWNGGSEDFSRWSANIRGVDLNHNYDAAWEQSTEAAELAGITGPGPTRYGGPKPESEPESAAVADFTRSNNFSLVKAYHSQGEVIYWNFMNMAPPEAFEIGRQLSLLSGYLLDTPEGLAGFAGYKDWFIKQYRRPGYTIEVGRGINPLPLSQFDSIYASCEGMLAYAATR